MATSPQFIDLTHHLSPEVLKRQINPLKEIIRIVLENPDLISLANGDPHASLYPIRSVSFEVASTATDDPVAAWRTLGAAAPTQTIGTASSEASDALFKATMKYGHGAGHSEALKTVAAITEKYHGATGHVPTLTLASADAITKVFRLLGGPGDFLLADEFTFTPMSIAAEAHDVNWVPVRIDGGGLIPADLERILEEWDDKRGRRPHVLYTTPCGQNPTGSTLSVERRKAIYAIAQKYDVIIVEDDPYYFLQYDEPGADPSAPEKPFPTSFLSLDVDGRVIRMDTFSKIMTPGLRLGWITSAPAIREHLVKLIDLSSQHPSGLPQVFVTQLLADAGSGGWALDGFDRWVRSLRREYQRRRDMLLALFAKDVAARVGAHATVEVPEAGMFLWINVHVEKHPRFARRTALVNGDAEKAEGLGEGALTNSAALMQELMDRCLAARVMVCPGRLFILNPTREYSEKGTLPIEERSNFVRVTFAGAEETMVAGMAIFGKVLEEFFAA